MKFVIDAQTRDISDEEISLLMGCFEGDVETGLFNFLSSKIDDLVARRKEIVYSAKVSQFQALTPEQMDMALAVIPDAPNP